MAKRIDAAEDDASRMCAVTRQRLPAAALLRFVAGPDGTLVPDLRRRLPGRGVSVGAEAKLVREAVRRRIFGQALKQDVTVPADLDGLVDRLMEADALQMLSMVNKAGLAVSGFEKVRQAIVDGGVAARIEASDGTADGRMKLDKVAVAVSGGINAIPVISLFAAQQLSLALGRENAIHALARAGPASAAFVERCRALAEFRSGPSPAAGPALPDELAKLPSNAMNRSDTDTNER